MCIVLYGICMISASSTFAKIPTSGNESDRLALLDLKSRVFNDPLGIMSSWNDSTHFCDWVGVTCNSNTGRVVGLDLEARKLSGSIPPSLGNMTDLTEITLRDNNFNGQIPQEFGRLLQLRHLNLYNNNFSGEIPTNITHCTQLVSLVLVMNRLVGQIPRQLFRLTKLELLGFGANNLTGTIPPWIGNLSSLLALSFARNNFEGNIPTELGRLSRLEFFTVAANNLTEYDIGSRISIEGDIFSYGILLLEMIIGKRPTGDTFGNGVDIHLFTTMTLPQGAMSIVDPSMLFEESRQEEENEDRIQEMSIMSDIVPRWMEECLVSIMRIGVSCSSRTPKQRTPMNVVVNELKAIKSSCLKFKNARRRYHR